MLNNVTIAYTRALCTAHMLQRSLDRGVTTGTVRESTASWLALCCSCTVVQQAVRMRSCIHTFIHQPQHSHDISIRFIRMATSEHVSDSRYCIGALRFAVVARWRGSAQQAAAPTFATTTFHTGRRSARSSTSTGAHSCCIEHALSARVNVPNISVNVFCNVVCNLFGAVQALLTAYPVGLLASVA
jgi:hypothetical protein